jgi:DNA polymerase
MLITLDLETYYDREYSLSKMTTEAYVRDPRFEVIGISIQINDEPPYWYPQPQVASALKTIDWTTALVVAQNTMFDGAILGWRYGVNPKGWIDIMGMSRALYPHEKSHSLKAQAERMGVGVKGYEVINALGKRYKDFDQEALARYGGYCNNDVELTYALFQRYVQEFPTKELKLIDLTLRMYIQPSLVLDRLKLLQHLGEVRRTKSSLLEAATVDKANLMSNPKFAQMLIDLGVPPPMKVSPTTGKETYAFAKTDEEFQRLTEHPDAQVQALVAARLGNKSTIEETRTEALIAIAERSPVLPIPLKYYGAHSGRWAGLELINLQNLPSRGANAGHIKRTILAPQGHVMIDCDSSQIEARTLAWLAGQDDLVKAFENKEDVYKIMASRIYNKPVEEIDKGERQVGKTVILGCGYGVGATKVRLFLKATAGVSVKEDEAKRIVQTYRDAYAKIPALWRQGEKCLRSLSGGQADVFDKQDLIKVVPEKGFLLPNGLYIQYPDLKRVPGEDGMAAWRYTSRGVDSYIYGGKVVENVCQAVARCIIGEQMLRIAKRYQPVLTVHDAIAIIAPEDEADEARAYVEECMSWRPKWAPGLPLACESGMGVSYGDC